jgi:hypothetical protein
MQCRGAFSTKKHPLEVHYYTTLFQNRSLRIRPINIGQEKTTRTSRYHVTTSVIKTQSSRSLAAATSSSPDTTSNSRVPNSQKGRGGGEEAKDPTTIIKEEEHSSNSSIGGFTFQGKWV